MTRSYDIRDPRGPLDYAKIADALDDLDSHGIYDRDAIAPLAALGIDTAKLSSQTVPALVRAIRSRGLGGYVEHEKGCPNDTNAAARCTCKLYTGHVVSAEVVMQLGYRPAGGAFYGRGSAHRANVEQLRKLAAETVTK